MRADEPAITVLMPTYNAERYLRQAVDSILAQTWSDFEFLIINDGSTDGTRALLASWTDPRLRIVDTAHGGLGAALQLGVTLARGRYLARMDADDESLPHRLEVQKAYLDRLPHVVLVHALAEAVDSAGRVVQARYGEPWPPVDTRWLLLWRNPIVHSTSMMRASTLRAEGLNYGPSPSEDFDLWNRLALLGDIHMIPDVLLRYRLHPQSFTVSNPRDAQLASFVRVITANLARYGVSVPPEVATDLAVISGGTLVDPITHSYQTLPGTLHVLLEDVSRSFCTGLGIEPRRLASVQSEQLARWARYMLHTSRSYAARLLWASLLRAPATARTRLVWAVLAGLALPRAFDAWMARRRRGPRAAYALPHQE